MVVIQIELKLIQKNRNESQQNSYFNSRAFCESELTFRRTGDMVGIIIISKAFDYVLYCNKNNSVMFM